MTSEVSELDESCVLGNVYIFFKLNVLFLYIIHVYILCTSTSPGRWCNSQVIQKYKEFHQLLSYFHPSAKVYLQFWLLSMVKYTVLTGIGFWTASPGVQLFHLPTSERRDPSFPPKFQWWISWESIELPLGAQWKKTPPPSSWASIFGPNRPSTGNVPVGARNLKDCPTPRSAAWKKIWGSFPQRFFQLLRNDYYKN